MQYKIELGTVLFTSIFSTFSLHDYIQTDPLIFWFEDVFLYIHSFLYHEKASSKEKDRNQLVELIFCINQTLGVVHTHASLPFFL